MSLAALSCNATDRCVGCWQHQQGAALLIGHLCSVRLLLLLRWRLLQRLLLLLKTPAGCKQCLALGCILHAKLQQSLVCQLQELFACTALQAKGASSVQNSLADELKKVDKVPLSNCSCQGTTSLCMRMMTLNKSYLEGSSCLGAKAQP